MEDSTPNQNNPAVDLASDILLTIFKFHGMMPHNLDICQVYAAGQINWDALLRLRFLSQTCSAWRSLMLNSPLLWARAIHLNSLCPRNRAGTITNDGNMTPWMMEVMHRAQTSPLWVVGYLDRPELTKVMVNLINKEGHRIERIIIELEQPQIDPELEDTITKEAPLLQQCHLHFNSNQITAAPPSYIFSNRAPFLTALSLQRIWIDHNATFLSGLRNLAIDIPTISISETLKILHKTPLLSSLQIASESVHMSDVDELSYVHLPHLTHITTPTLIPYASALLEYIVPSPRCSLSLNFRARGYFEPRQEQTPPVISFLKRFLKHHSPRRIELYIVSYISFQIVFSSGEENNGPEFFFDYSNFRNRHHIPMNNITMLLEALSIPEISCAKEFRFETWGVSIAPHLLKEVIVNTFSTLLLPGLEVFIVEQDLLAVFFEPYQDQSSTPICKIFPRLRTIVVKGLGGYDIRGGETLEDVLLRFLDEVY